MNQPIIPNDKHQTMLEKAERLSQITREQDEAALRQAGLKPVSHPNQNQIEN